MVVWPSKAVGLGILGILAISLLTLGFFIMNPSFNPSPASAAKELAHAKVILYSKASCPYCLAAKRLLTKKGVSFEEIDIALHPERREEMLSLSGGLRTVPQIFINSQPIGGFDALQALADSGKLDELLKISE